MCENYDFYHFTELHVFPWDQKFSIRAVHASGASSSVREDPALAPLLDTLTLPYTEKSVNKLLFGIKKRDNFCAL